MSAKAAAKAMEAAPRSSAEIAVERDKQIALRDAAEAAYQQLDEGLGAATLAGVEERAAHKRKMETAEGQVHVARARADDLVRQFDEAVARERNDGLLGRYRRVAERAARMRPEIEAAYVQLREVFDVLCRERALDIEIGEINALLQKQGPEDLPQLLRVEAFRFEAATAAEYEDVEVEREAQVYKAVHSTSTEHPDGVISVVEFVVRDGVRVPRTEVRRVKERRVVKQAVGGFTPAPLYDMFAVPRLRRDDPHLIVPGTRARAWWSPWEG